MWPMSSSTCISRESQERMFRTESIFTFTQLNRNFLIEMFQKASLCPHANKSIIDPLYEETPNLENSGFPWCSLATLLFGLTNISGNGVAWVSVFVQNFMFLPDLFLLTYSLNQNYSHDIISSVKYSIWKQSKTPVHKPIWMYLLGNLE